ncbi:MAG: FAD binding domain-containing protein [bacterium]
MKPAPFEYFTPKTVEEVLFLLTQHGFDAKVLAGGQSLVPTMNFRLAQPAVLIDLNQISELFYVRAENPQELRIGAMTRQRELERNALIRQQTPLVHETVPHIAHPQIRNRGTIGGAIAHADPAAELPAVMVALNARFHLRCQNQERWISAKDFFIDLFTTALEPEELLMEIALPALAPHSGWAFREIARRPGDYAMAGVAVMVHLDDKAQCQEAKIVFLSVGNGPVVADQAAKILSGVRPDAKLIHAAAETAASQDIDPSEDIHASADYRRHLVKILTEQALTAAFARAEKQTI